MLTDREKLMAYCLGLVNIVALTIGGLTLYEKKAYDKSKQEIEHKPIITSALTSVDSRDIKDYSTSSVQLDIQTSNDSIKAHEVTTVKQRYLRCDPVSETSKVATTIDESRVSIGEQMILPDGYTNFYMYMDYRSLTNTSSKQYQLQYDGSCWIDNDGFRRHGNDYMVAVGTVYGEVGDRLRIWTDMGNCYDCIVGDCKGSDAIWYDDSHSWYHICGDGKKNVIEFIVDTDLLPYEVRVSGSCGEMDYLAGNIVKIERYGD